MFKNKTFKKIFGHTRKEATKEAGEKLYNDELHNW
jgi:hypothetical protein